MLFDIEHCEWWPPFWGARPPALADAFAVGRERLQLEPKLIPIFGHRFLPAEPDEAGNPVISMSQMMDTIYYARDLRDFFVRDSDLPRYCREPIGEVRKIRFWSAVIDRWWWTRPAV